MAGRSAKVGEAVFKASVLNWLGGRSASRSTKISVVVFKASTFNWLGVDSTKFDVAVIQGI